MINCGSKKEPSVNKMLKLFISKCYIITYFKKNILQKDKAKSCSGTAAEQWAPLKLDVRSREWHMWNLKILGPRGKVKLSIVSLTIETLSLQPLSCEMFCVIFLTRSSISHFVCKITSGYCGVLFWDEHCQQYALAVSICAVHLNSL